MLQKLDTDREILTLNGRPLRLISRTVDGRIVLQSARSRSLVIVDDHGRNDDGKEVAVNREALRVRMPTNPRALPLIPNGTSVLVFRFSRRDACLFRATFVGYSYGRTTCKVAPEVAVGGRELLKVPRHATFEDSAELAAWCARLQHDVNRLMPAPGGSR